MKLSVIIPARNEENNLRKVFMEINEVLKREGIENEIILVDDNSTDGTRKVIEELVSENSNVRGVFRKPPPGFGRAIRDGLKVITGDVVEIVMADFSDDPEDIVRYYRKILEGYDCVFGSRFIKGSRVVDYPPHKLILNRIANNFIKILFGIKNNDITNAFKAYRREVIEAVQPLVSNHFNITVEIPLKAINRGFRFATIPISWYGRTSGVSKYRLKELQRKYLFSLLYCWLERILLKDEVKK